MFNFVCISGFNQDESRIPGTWQLSEKLRAAGYSSGSRLRVTHLNWRSDWSNKAAEIANVAKYYGETPRTAIFAYSWGAGFGAMSLARELDRRGLAVDKCVLSDPVYRHPWAPMRWLALLGGSEFSQLHIFAPPIIRLPPNIREVWTFHQRLNSPRGHRVAAGGSTIVHPSFELRRIHGEMDDAPEFHARALEAAAEMVGQYQDHEKPRRAG